MIGYQISKQQKSRRWIILFILSIFISCFLGSCSIIRYPFIRNKTNTTVWLKVKLHPEDPRSLQAMSLRGKWQKGIAPINHEYNWSPAEQDSLTFEFLGKNVAITKLPPNSTSLIRIPRGNYDIIIERQNGQKDKLGKNIPLKISRKDGKSAQKRRYFSQDIPYFDIE